MKKDVMELQSFNDGLWEIDLHDVSVDALERRFELAVAVAIAEPCGIVCESVCSPICGQVCGTFCSPIASDL